MDRKAIELEIGRRITEMKRLTDEANEKHDGMMPGEFITQWDDHQKAILSLKDQVKRMSDVAGLLGEQPNVNDGDRPANDDGAGRKSEDGRYLVGPRGAGHTLFESDEIKNYMKSFPGGRPAGNHPVVSPSVPLKSLRPQVDQKDFVVTGASATSAGSLVWPQFDGLTPYWASYQRPLVVRQLFSQATTETDTIEYVRITSVSNNAAMRSEATSEDMPVLPSGSYTPGASLTNVAGGGYAAESGMVFERDTVLVQDIAHWMPVTKRALADAGQIQSQIDIFLGYGIEATLETQFLSGNGTAPNLTGLTNVSGVQTISQTALPTRGGSTPPSDPFVALRIGITDIRVNAHCEPTAILMHPQDWEGIDLQRSGVYNGTSVTGAGNFLGAGPFDFTAPRLWGKPVVQSEAVTPGSVFVAAWNRAVVYDRQQASIQMTDQHADFFIRGLVAILAEERLSFAVLHPQAFLEVTNFSSVAGLGGSSY